MFKNILKIGFFASLFLVAISVIVVDDTDTSAINYSSIAYAQESVERSGSGQQVTDRFELDGGIAVFSLTHNGGSNFIVELLDTSGNTVELLVNHIGAFDGSVAVAIPAGAEYLLDINADGNWTVAVDQSIPDSVDSAPIEFSGTGDKATEFFGIGEGLATFEMSHSGSSNFIVELKDLSGNTVDLLVNEIGAFDGSTASRIDRSGIYILNVTADDDWSINIDGEELTEEEAEVAQSGEASGDNGDTEGCFVATVVYGDANAPDINVLRDFRDDTLLQSEAGEKFVTAYYDHGKNAADFIANRPIAKKIVKYTVVEPAVALTELFR